MYHNMDDLIDVCISHMANEHFTPEQVRLHMKDMLPELDYWKNYTYLAGSEKFEEFKRQLISEINALHVEGMPRVEKLNALVGGYINLEYRLPNGKCVKFLNDEAAYLGNQLECEFGGERCFGIAANMDFIMVSTYEKDGENPELVIYKKDKPTSICTSPYPWFAFGAELGMLRSALHSHCRGLRYRILHAPQ